MPNLNDPNIDFALQDQLQKAKWLRAQEMQQLKEKPYEGTARYVAPFHWGSGVANTLRNVAGTRNQNQAETSMNNLSAEQIRRIDELNQQLNNSGNVNWADPQAIQAENARRAEIVGKMQQLPMAAQTAGKIQENLQKFPEAMMKQKQQADAIATRQAEQQAAYKDMQDQRLAQAAAMAAQERQNRLLIQAMKNQNSGSVGGTRKMTSAEKKSLMQTQDLLGKVDEAIGELEKQPDAVGLKTKMPSFILQRLFPEGVTARASIGELSADKKHELLGSAMTKTEIKLVEPFLPSDGDTYEKSMDNLKRLKRGLQRILKARESGTEVTEGDFQDLYNEQSSTVPADTGEGLTVIETKNGVNLMSDGSYQMAE